MQKRIHIIAAARPNFMKISPLWRVLSQKKWADVRIIHTGQHYDYAMSDTFFEQLCLPSPYKNLNVQQGTHGQQTGRVIELYESLLLQERPDLVIVVGDVNATFATTLAAVKLCIPVAHVEAGLRAYDRTMPEEINRILTDAICDYLWTPSLDANANLAKEGIDAHKITFVGNIMIDTLHMLLPQIKECKPSLPPSIKNDAYALVTLHRPSNVDGFTNLQALCLALEQCSKCMPLVFPLHPRTKLQLEKFHLLDLLKNNPHIHLMPPQPYLEFMNLVIDSRIVITDSGGIQEETSYLGIPCLTVRKNTERPITIELGTNQLINIEDMFTTFEKALQTKRKTTNIPYWDGNTALRIVEHMENFLQI